MLAFFDFYWRPQGDLNPCYRRERPMSWTGLDDGDAFLCMAGGQGFEPWLTGPEPVVLPLDDPPTGKIIFSFSCLLCQAFFIFLSRSSNKNILPSTGRCVIRQWL